MTPQHGLVVLKTAPIYSCPGAANEMQTWRICLCSHLLQSELQHLICFMQIIRSVLYTEHSLTCNAFLLLSIC